MVTQRREEEEEQSGKGFTVADRRLFTREGERRTPDAAPPPPVSPPPPPRQETKAREAPRRPQPGAPGAAGKELPPADFSTFVMMLANNVLMFLGQIPDPATQQRRRDLQQARHTIDILTMLREKTRGNLTAEEEKLMADVVPQLQMAYVSLSRQGG